MALVLRIIDEIPRHRSEDQLHGMSFQKDRRLSVSTKVPKNFARTPPPAFLFPDQRFQRPGPEEPAGLFSAGPRRRRLFSCLSFRCQAVLFKELSFHQTAPGRSGGGGYLVKADPLVNRAFQPFCSFENRSFRHPQKTAETTRRSAPQCISAIRLKRGD